MANSEVQHPEADSRAQAKSKERSEKARAEKKAKERSRHLVSTKVSVSHWKFNRLV